MKAPNFILVLGMVVLIAVTVLLSQYFGIWDQVFPLAIGLTLWSLIVGTLRLFGVPA